MVEENLSKKPINHTTLAWTVLEDNTGGQYWRLETGGQYSILNTGGQYWRTVGQYWGQWTVDSTGGQYWRTVLEDNTGGQC